MTRVKAAVAWSLETLCALTRHAGCCMVLNRRILLGPYDEAADKFFIDVPNRLTYRLYGWATNEPSP